MDVKSMERGCHQGISEADACRCELSSLPDDAARICQRIAQAVQERDWSALSGDRLLQIDISHAQAGPGDTPQTLMQRCEEEGRALSALLTQNQQRPHAMRFPAADLLRAEGEIAGVPAELQSALSNLVNNAVRYTPGGGSIEVQWLRKEDGSAVFSVHDTGLGIAPEHIPRLTERFYRVDRSRSRETGGTGLGLAIVKHVLQRHGATLDIASTLGKGSVFSVTFPANRLRPDSLRSWPRGSGWHRR